MPIAQILIQTFHTISFTLIKFVKNKNKNSNIELKKITIIR